ncbi:MAG TPA: DUF4105 domain-containing protein [Gemmatimonadales bacterium]|nr:DUF4105 domain-containing protein [Gemmatimonadales bacterium]
MRPIVTAAIAIASMFVARPAGGQAPAGEPGSELTISLVTMGPGRYVWERFGHNAIRVTDHRTGADTTYNYGMFDFGHENFFANFATGRMDYWMEGHDAIREVSAYMRDDRSVWVQVLNLTPRQRLELRDFLQWNARPENRFYRYHYYYDNCSTRVRDAIDRVLGGAIRRGTDSVASGATYRSHTRRLTENDLFIYTGINIGLSRPTDRPISEWEEMFLPLALREHVRSITVPDENGVPRPLVASEETLYVSTGDPPPTAPPRWWPRYLGVGLLVGALVAVSGHRRHASRGARTLFAMIGALWSVVAGIAGILLVYLWCFTDHVTSYANENLLQLSPLSLALVVLIPLVAFGKSTGRAGGRISIAVAILSLIGLALKLLPAGQVNGEIIALALPIHLGVAGALLRRPRPSS